MKNNFGPRNQKKKILFDQEKKRNFQTKKPGKKENYRPRNQKKKESSRPIIRKKETFRPRNERKKFLVQEIRKNRNYQTKN